MTYLFVVNHKRHSDLGFVGPLRVEGVFSVAYEISWEIIMVIPFEGLGLGVLGKSEESSRHFDGLE